jgi:hypothetical protein
MLGLYRIPVYAGFGLDRFHSVYKSIPMNYLSNSSWQIMYQNREVDPNVVVLRQVLLYNT